MNNNRIKKEIQELKISKKAIIFAHNYQLPEVQDISDFVGDSFELAKKAAELTEFERIVFCGAKFMAETAKILSPRHKVLLAEIDAGCPMAEMAQSQDVVKLKSKYPDAWVVSYVNTNADVKAVSDICCTSSNADKIVKNIPAKQIIFLPDKNLCWYVKNKVKEKEIICWDGYCYVHRQFTANDILESKKLYPEARVIVHPECEPEVQQLADDVYSTSGMLQVAKESDSNIFVVGTEEGLIHRMRKENPNKTFYSLGPPRICSDMKKTTLHSVKNALEKEEYLIEIPKEINQKAKVALERMIKYT